ncbi:SPOR domain-containing protein [Puniceibacterium confluentis]|uniref:SPOR domain-containing protein n=1 Tax=Puniceibacterium confluentis TaxID=1958944 RepID=UPI003563253D
MSGGIMSPEFRGKTLRSVATGLIILTLGACDNARMPGFLQPKAKADSAAADGPRKTQLVERDIEAPEVFQATEAGLWDGRPSLGGVWVAHPDVKDPERVIVRNEKNGQFVIGALFRRERETPGPRLQISSDAAAALGMLAGQPANLNVVALRREEVAAEPEAPVSPPAVGAAQLDAPSEITEGALDPVVADASAAIAAAPLAPAAPPAAVAAAAAVSEPSAAAPKPATAPAKAAAMAKPFIQLGIFSVEENANNTATAMRQAGMVPTVKKQSSSGKAFWRVLVGPVQNAGELDALLGKIKAKGFNDAYAVSN